jgi:hypothetical protein
MQLSKRFHLRDLARLLACGKMHTNALGSLKSELRNFLKPECEANREVL